MSRRLDTVESLTNTAVGITLAYAVNLWVLPMIGVATTPSSALGITAIFVVVSTARSYVLRRLFRRIGA